ncbi:MAG: hypothetical protein NTY14_02405 [Candidatus Omnitrophica bacterium]|nr:hypothetical protein [Candidatus Omnitrophota bacterium]
MKMAIETRIIGIVLLLVILFAAWAGPHIHGDSVSYYMMISSLAKDGDLVLDHKEAQRWDKEKFEAVPVGVYVRMDAAGNMRYAKPVIYPVVAAFFFLIFGRLGLAGLNGLLLGLCIVFSYLGLRRYLGRRVSLLIAAGFFLFSFVPAYISWVTPDIFLFFSCSLCIFLLSVNKPMACAFIIGLIAGEKITFLLMLIPLAGDLAAKNKIKQLLKALGFCSFGLILTILLTRYCLKTFFAYSDPKYILFGGAIPQSLEELRLRLVLAPSELADMRFNSPQLFSSNIVNFFTGRFSGILWYGFPAAVCILIYLWRRKSVPREQTSQGDSILLTAVILAVVLLVFRPLNYFGGIGFFGNRYFFIYPALLLPAAFKGIKKPLLIFLFFLPAVLVSSQVLVNSLNLNNWHKSSWRGKNVDGLAAHGCTMPLRYAGLEVNAVENLPLYSFKFFEGLTLYAPRGLKNGADKQIFLEGGQEAVFVLKNKEASLKLKTSAGEFVIRPVLVLADKVSKELRSFFYFKPGSDLKLISVIFADK